MEVVTSPSASSSTQKEIVEKPSEHEQNDRAAAAGVVEKDETISALQEEGEEEDIEKDGVNDEALKVKDAPELQPFFKMLRLGVPMEAVKLKMSREDLNPDLLDIPDADYDQINT